MSYIIFSRWFGLISVILALGVLFNLDDAKAMARNLVQSESGYILGGVLPIIFGSLAFMEQHSFSATWQLVVTLIGLLMLIAGLFRVFFVDFWKKILLRHLDTVPILFSLFGLIFGLLMLYVGFIAPIVAYQ